jgi:internalin A
MKKALFFQYGVLCSLAFLFPAVVMGCEDSDKKKQDLIAKTGGSGAPSSSTVIQVPSALLSAIAASASAQKQTKPPKECPPGNEITIDNKEVEGEVRAKAKKPEGPLTPADLEKVTSIRINQGKTPLEEIDPCVFPKFTALKFLYLPKGSYRDLTPIANLTRLEGLFIPDSEVEDLKPLEKLLKLDQLGLTRTHVRDITVLGNLTSLTELTLDDTQVSDIAVLAKLTKLEKLSLKNTLVKDVSPLKDMKKLKQLNVAGTSISNLDTLEPLKRANNLKILTN